MCVSLIAHPHLACQQVFMYHAHMPIYDDPNGDNWRYENWRGHDDAARMVTMVPVDFLLTEEGAAPSRLRVDNGSTGFFAGKEFRFFYEFSIANGESAWIKVVVPTDSTAKFQDISVDEGGVRFRVWSGSTEIGPFFEPASPTGGYFSLNQAAQDKYGYVRQSSVLVGGNGAALTDGTVSEIVRVVTSGASGHRSTVGSGSIAERGIPAGTYHLQLENIASSGIATGVYGFVLEERAP